MKTKTDQSTLRLSPLWAIVLIFQVFLGCHQKNSKESSVGKNNRSVVYEIFIQSFYDTNDDGIGDLQGVIQKLDYIQSLGAGAIWLMPIMPSPSYHKYDVSDYYDIHPDYGTLDDFKQLLDEAHERNIDVIIDLVINHTSSDHMWFKSASKGAGAPYRQFYVWDNEDSIRHKISRRALLYDTDNISQWHSLEGDSSGERYYGFFYHGMPDLNFDNQDVRTEVYKIGKYWLEMGVDGFRMDAAKYIYPEHRSSDSHNFWQEFQIEMKRTNPDVYLVGEVWADNNIAGPFYKGFNSLFNFDLSRSITESLIQEMNVSYTIKGDKSEDNDLIESLIRNKEFISQYKSELIDGIFLSNHDQNRIASQLDSSISKAKLAASILLTLPGRPYIYYGEEIGMLGKKPDEHIREPMLWEIDNNDFGRTNWLESIYSTNFTVKPVSMQSTDPESILSHYKKLISFRNSCRVISHGHLEMSNLDHPGIISYISILNDKRLITIHNVSSDTIQLSTNLLKTGYSNPILNMAGIEMNSDQIVMPAYSSVVLQ